MVDFVPLTQLTDSERTVYHAFALGRRCDLSTAKDKTVRAPVIAALLTDKYPPANPGMPGLHLAGAQITGEFDIAGRTIEYLVDMEKCTFDRPLLISMSTLVGLRLSGCLLPGLRGQNVTVNSDLRLNATFNSDGSVEQRFTCEGRVDLTDATVNGTLRLTDAVLHGDRRAALLAARIRVSGSVQAIDMRATGELRLRGANIGGSLHFSGVQMGNVRGDALEGTGIEVEGSLLLDGVRVHGGRVVLSGANVGGAAIFSGAYLYDPSGLATRGQSTVVGQGKVRDSYLLAADRMRVDGDVRLDAGFTAEGTVALRGAEIGGHLQLSGATIGRPDAIPPLEQAFISGEAVTAVPVALIADGARIGGDVDARGATNGHLDGDGDQDSSLRCYGQLRLVGAKVDGSASLVGVRLVGPAIDVLFADRLVVGGTLFLRKLVARGSLRLQNAHIGSSVDCSGATLTEPRLRSDRSLKPSLDLRVGTIGKDLLCSYGFRATGGVRMRQVEVGKMATFAGARLGSADEDNAARYSEIALNAFGLSVQELVLTFDEQAPPDGQVVLTRAHAVSVVDSAALWSATGGVELEDFRFQAVAARPEVPVSTRLDWLRAVQPDFAPGPYEQLAKVYRDGGDEERARRVQIERQRRRYKELGPAGRLWGQMQEATVGYGYRPWLAMLWLAGFWLIGTLWFAAHVMTKLDNDQNPVWNPPLLSMDLLLPIVNLGQDQMWRMIGPSQWIAGVLTAVGWILASTAAAGATRVLKRD